MNLKTPINENYAGVFTTITQTVKLDNCDNVHHAIIFGSRVIVDKGTQLGSKGIFFPAETQLSDDFLHNNNLYKDNTLNKDTTQKGYFEKSGRIKCMKFRGHKSEGLFMPISSLLFAALIEDLSTLKERDTFDNLNGIEICRKYVPKNSKTPGTPGSKSDKYKPKKTSRLVDGQFRFHGDTSMLGKNIHRIKPTTLLSITNKLHGTSFVVSNVITKKKLHWKEKLARFFGIPIRENMYDIIYSSRKVIKNDDMRKEYNHYYDTDVWGEIAEALRDFMPKGMTIYGEAVGFTKTGKAIQSGYDYGYDMDNDVRGRMGIYIYRITYTNIDGVVFEFSAKQVQDWCQAFGLNAVPEYFYGYARELFPTVKIEDGHLVELSLEEWQGELLAKLLDSYNMEKDCELCVNPVPAEGIVVRIEGESYDAYKLKAFRFRVRETEELDKGVVDIETEESQTEI